MKRYLTLFVFGAALSMLGGTSSYAQTSGETGTSSTQQTDQSEDAWRKSKKKTTSTDPFDPFKNSRNFGAGLNLPPLRPIDSLPEDSRRHLMRQRAKVIATEDMNPDPSAPKTNSKHTVYKLSEAAKTDPALAKEEEEAWEVIMTDLQGAKGGKPSQSASGPHKVAIAGRGGDQTGSVMRGGSAHSAAEIMARLKGLKTGGTGGTGTLPTGEQGQQTGSGQQGQPQGQGQTPQGQDQSQPGNTQTASGQRGGSAQSTADILTGIKGHGSEQGRQGQTQGQPGTAQTQSVMRGGSAQSASEIMAGMKGANTGQSQQSGDTNNDAAPQTTSQTGQASNDAAQGQQQSTQTGSNAAATDAANDSGAAGEAAKKTTPEILSPLSLPETTGPSQQVECSQSSASAYLKQAQGSDDDVNSCD